MKQWKCLVWENKAKTNINSVRTKVCEAEEVTEHFMNPKIKNEVFG